MSNQPLTQLFWVWSPNLRQWYWHDRRTDQYVLQSGARVPRALVTESQNRLPGYQQLAPPNDIDTYQQPYYPQSDAQYAGLPVYGSYTARPQTLQSSIPNPQPPSSEALAAQLQRLKLGTHPESRFTTNRRQVSFGVVTETTDNLTKVETISQTEPKNVITDQTLLREGAVARRMLHPTPNDEETLDPRFKIRKKPAEFFITGRVFLILWAEPAGESNQSAVSAGPTMISGMWLGSGVFGERIHQKVRRFVVVREADQFCTALPIGTYGGKGVSKDRVKKSDHAIIYSGRQPPQPVDNEMPKRGERGMRPNAIRVDPDEREDKLDPMSRIDFGKPHTVHHNLKVRSFGMVNGRSREQLLSQFKAVIVDGIASDAQQSAIRKRPNVKDDSTMIAEGTKVRDYGQVHGNSQVPGGMPRRLPRYEEGDTEGEDNCSDSKCD